MGRIPVPLSRVERVVEWIDRSLARLRAARRAFARRPAFMRWHVEAALGSLPDLRESLRGRDLRPFESAIREAEEAAEYAQASLDNRSWDAALADLDRVVAAWERIGAVLGPSRRTREPRFGRRAVVHFLDALVLDRTACARTLSAWRRLDLALRSLDRACRSGDPARIADAVRTVAAPERLRPLYRVGPVQRDVRREVGRLFNEAQEAAEYALAALDQGVWSAAQTDVERIDAALRALRNVLQRESPLYLPEPWPLRLPGRMLAARAARREARSLGKDEIERLLARSPE